MHLSLLDLCPHGVFDKLNYGSNDRVVVRDCSDYFLLFVNNTRSF